MSGFSQERRQRQLITLLDGFGLARHYKVMNDSVGSAFTLSPEGGFVVIAGTGSFAHVVTPSANRRAGGWGHSIGDGEWLHLARL